MRRPALDEVRLDGERPAARQARRSGNRGSQERARAVAGDGAAAGHVARDGTALRLRVEVEVAAQGAGIGPLRELAFGQVVCIEVDEELAAVG